MSRLIDLTGQKFGKLTVLERVENKGKGTKWLCQCECGNKKEVFAANLKRGLTTSCGCYRKEKLSELKLEDLTGQKFGRLTVQKIHHYSEKSRQYYWECRCECGGTAIVYSGHLKSGHTKSCGCLISNGEEYISNLLENAEVNFIKQYKFNDLRGLNGGLLRFDFAIFENKELKFLIEYDGWQHTTKSNTKWDKEGRFEDRQEHDKMKNQYCQKNQIPLIRISFNELKDLTIEDLNAESKYLIEKEEIL